jgi:hypothetical protein
MSKRLLAVALGFGLLTLPAIAEVSYNTLSVSDTSATAVFPTPRQDLLICNYGDADVHYRLFFETDTPAVATTGNILLVAGTSTAPLCKSYSKAQTAPSFYKAISIVTATGTATVTVESQ